jgi:hypothetical protein
MITENTDGATINMQSFKQFVTESLPAHLQKIADKHNAKQAAFKVTDVTPAGYGPGDDSKTVSKSEALAAGKSAFTAGKDRVPPSTGGYDMSTKKEWLKGWDLANIAAPIDESVLEEATVEQLKAAYSNINSIDPDSASYKKLVTLLDKLDNTTLQNIVDAKVKFVSSLALNRLNRK